MPITRPPVLPQSLWHTAYTAAKEVEEIDNEEEEYELRTEAIKMYKPQTVIADPSATIVSHTVVGEEDPEEESEEEDEESGQSGGEIDIDDDRDDHDDHLGFGLMLPTEISDDLDDLDDDTDFDMMNPNNSGQTILSEGDDDDQWA